MIYAKWLLDFSADPRYGVGPDAIVVGRGDSIEGAWQITEVTQAEILEKAQEGNPECYIGDDGKVTAPIKIL